ncbi:MAG: hypothetical protein ACRQFF_07355 [Sphaerochaeta sp.]
MNKKVAVVAIIIVMGVLVACNDKNYITGQVGPSRGIVFDIQGSQIEAKVCNTESPLTYSDSQEFAADHVEKVDWQKSYDDYRLPTESELQAIIASQYSQALGIDDESLAKLYYKNDSDSTSKSTGTSVEDYEGTDILLVRDL